MKIMNRLNSVVRLVSSCCLLFSGAGAFSQEDASIWVEDSFEDFADGTLDASGQNIYVSRGGSVRTIQRFDINDDGYIDLFFGNTHDHYNRIDPTMATVSTGREFISQSLPVPGSNEVDKADLNKDGWTDLVFTLERSGLQHGRVFLWILYGGDDGWTQERSSVLPANGPRATEIVDLNGDGWLDIAVLNRVDGPYTPERNIRIYWGADTGFLLSQYQDVGLPGAVDLDSGDLDGDSVSDLIALQSNEIRIFWGIRTDTSVVHSLRDERIAGFWGEGSGAIEIELVQTDLEIAEGGARSLAIVDADANGTLDILAGTSEEKLFLVPGEGNRRFSGAKAVPSFPASSITIGDVDSDGYSDLIFSNMFIAGRTTTAGGEMGSVDSTTLSPLRLLWGSAEGIDWNHPSELKADFAFDASIGDLDGDGMNDIAVAIFQDTSDQRYDSQSLVYFGSGDRKFELSKEPVATTGATGAALVPPENGLPGRAVFANRLKGTLYERVPVYVYWGKPDGFDPDDRWVIPGQSGHEATGADFNADGYLDLAMTFTAHGGHPALKNPIIGTNILWGGRDGYDLEDPSRRTILREPYMDTSTTADLNKDGYLDLVLGGWEQWHSDAEDTEAQIAIYYGSKNGFELENKVALRSEGRSNGVNIADFNKDGWLDISVTSRKKSRVRIFWGSAEGFDENNQHWLTVPIAMGTEIADFNSDGWLDLVVSSYRDYVNTYNDTGNVIFWGGSNGFQHWNSQWLPGSCSHYQAVADFDSDGFLDLFVPNYHGQLRRGEFPSYLFWGSADGFDLRRKTNLVCDSACGAQAGDFNGDGLVDLAVAEHSSSGSHQVDSKVFYNDGNRFANPDVTRLPTLGAHMMWVQDMGHIYNRSHEQTYESSVFEWEGIARSARITYEAKHAHGSGLELSVRAAKDRESLKDEVWRPCNKGTVNLSPDHRLMQYRFTFRSKNGDRYSVLNQVNVELKK